MEDTSYRPELWSSHGRAELEMEPDVPIMNIDDAEVVAVTPASPSETLEMGQKPPPPTPSPVSPLDTPETTKNSPDTTTVISPVDTPGTKHT